MQKYKNGTQFLRTVRVGIPKSQQTIAFAHKRNDISGRTKYFQKYNAQFETTKEVIVKEKIKKDFFKGSIVLGMNQFSMNVRDNVHPINSQNFGTFIAPSLGAELEFTLPYSNDKWSFLLQPTYNSTISGKIQSLRYYDDEPMESEFSYQAIEIPCGIRYRYFFNNKFCINATGYVSTGFLSWNNTTIKVDRLNFDVLERTHRFAFGLGADYKKFSIEIKACESRNFFVKYRTWKTDFKALSVCLKYRLVDLKINR
ncbi:MAG: hypothetical protein GZ091_05425 [Paludibacter sp.]|nr:hypothetical protein [Paludibacter sp.]